MELTRRDLIKGSASILGYASLLSAAPRQSPHDPLPSWNEGPAKHAIVDFVRATTDKGSPKFVPLEDRIPTFDQDGTTWAEPIYSQVLFAYDRLASIATQHQEWKTTQPFQSVLTRDKKAMEKFTLKDIETIVMATHTGMTVGAFQKIVKNWIEAGKISSARGVRQLERRPADARIHAGGRRSLAGDAGTTRRWCTRICLRPGPGAA
jgi:hypothetical protein